MSGLLHSLQAGMSGLVPFPCSSACVLCMCALRVGPKEELDSTVISQPAIYVSSLAAIEKLRQTEGEVRACILRVSSSTHCTGFWHPPSDQQPVGRPLTLMALLCRTLCNQQTWLPASAWASTQPSPLPAP